MSFFFFLGGVAFGIGVWPGILAPSFWFYFAVMFLLSISMALFETKLNKIRDYLRMLHDHQHPEVGTEDHDA